MLKLPLLLALAVGVTTSRIARAFSPPLATARWWAANQGPSSKLFAENEDSGDNHQVYWLDSGGDSDLDSDYDDYGYDDLALLDTSDQNDRKNVPLGQSIALGQAVVCIPNVASTDECNLLFAAGLAACERRVTPAARGRSRFSVADPEAFSSEVVLNCEEILLRVMDYLDEHIPSIYKTLFRPGDKWLDWQPLDAQLEQPTVPPEEYLADTCDGLRDLYMMGELEWSLAEPCIKCVHRVWRIQVGKALRRLTRLYSLPLSLFSCSSIVTQCIRVEWLLWCPQGSLGTDGTHTANLTDR